MDIRDYYRNKKKKEPPHSRRVYLIDPVRQDYIEDSIDGMARRLDKSSTFINGRIQDHELFIIKDRAYYLVDNFGEIWDFL